MAISTAREAWLVLLESGDGDQETELVTLDGITVQAGATLEGTNGQRLTFLESVTETIPDPAA